MSTELLIVIITVIGNVLITLIGILANIYITKISNADKVHEFKRHLTKYEVITKSPEWIVATAEDDDALYRYDSKTRVQILARYKKINGKVEEAVRKLEEQEAVYAMAMGPIKANEKKDKDTSDDDNSTNW